LQQARGTWIPVRRARKVLGSKVVIFRFLDGYYMT